MKFIQIIHTAIMSLSFSTAVFSQTQPRLELVYREGNPLPEVPMGSVLYFQNSNQRPNLAGNFSQNNLGDSIFKLEFRTPDGASMRGIWKKVDGTISPVLIGDSSFANIPGLSSDVRFRLSPSDTNCGDEFGDPGFTPATMNDSGDIFLNTFVRGSGIRTLDCSIPFAYNGFNYGQRLGTDKVSVLLKNDGTRKLLFQSGIDFQNGLPTFSETGELQALTHVLSTTQGSSRISENHILGSESGWLWTSASGIPGMTNVNRLISTNLENGERFNLTNHLYETIQNGTPPPHVPNVIVFPKLNSFNPSTGRSVPATFSSVSYSPNRRFVVFSVPLRYPDQSLSSNSLWGRFVIDTHNPQLISPLVIPNKPLTQTNFNNPDVIRSFDPSLPFTGFVPAVGNAVPESVSINDHGDVSISIRRAVSVELGFQGTKVLRVSLNMIRGTRNSANGSYVFRSIAQDQDPIPGSDRFILGASSAIASGFYKHRILSNGDILTIIPWGRVTSTFQPEYFYYLVRYRAGENPVQLMGPDRTYPGIDGSTVQIGNSITSTTYSGGAYSIDLAQIEDNENSDFAWQVPDAVSPLGRLLNSLVIYKNSTISILKNQMAASNSPNHRFDMTAVGPVRISPRGASYLAANPADQTTDGYYGSHFILNSQGQLSLLSLHNLRLGNEDVRITQISGALNEKGTMLASALVGPQSLAAVFQLSIEASDIDPPTECLADFDDSGVLNVSDLFAFLDAFYTRDPAADLGNDGQVSVQDLFTFLELYSEGCP